MAEPVYKFFTMRFLEARYQLSELVPLGRGQEHVGHDRGMVVERLKATRDTLDKLRAA